MSLRLELALRRPPFVSLGTALVAGCFVGVPEGTGGSGPAVEATSSGSGSHEGTGAAGGGPSGLPCDIDALLAASCRSCHGNPPSAPMPLVTYDDLVADAVSAPSRRVADVALERMDSPTAPMPPGPAPAVASDERAAFRAWIDAGLPAGTCGEPGGASSGGGGGSAPAALVCTSGEHWTDGRDARDAQGEKLDEEGPWMNPGSACIACHLASTDKGSIVQLGGTVYPTLHEPDLCYGVDGTTSDAHVVVTDANDNEFTMPLERTGNFSLALSAGPLAFPIRAKVVANGLERAMNAAQNTGDCNGCHTEQGQHGAPGRILLP